MQGKIQKERRTHKIIYYLYGESFVTFVTRQGRRQQGHLNQNLSQNLKDVLHHSSHVTMANVFNPLRYAMVKMTVGTGLMKIIVKVNSINAWLCGSSCTQGDLIQIFPLFTNPICSKFGLPYEDGPRAVMGVKWNSVELPTICRICYNPAISSKWPFYFTEMAILNKEEVIFIIYNLFRAKCTIFER